MFRELINTVPFGIIIIIFISLFVLVTYLASVLSSKFSIVGDEQHHILMAHSIMTILTGGFFVLLAFIIINTWNYMQEARTSVSKEATNLAIMVRALRAFPPDIQNELRKATEDYIRAVRVKEWETMRHGKDSPEADEDLEHLYALVQNYDPKTPHESFYYSFLASHLNSMIQARRERLNKIESLIPNILSLSIFWGAIFIAFILGFVRGKDNVYSLVPTLLFAGLLGFNWALALNFDYPFSGDISVSNKSFYSGILKTVPDK